jgi:hypothetical protein
MTGVSVGLRYRALAIGMMAAGALITVMGAVTPTT